MNTCLLYHILPFRQPFFQRFRQCHDLSSGEREIDDKTSYQRHKTSNLMKNWKSYPPPPRIYNALNIRSLGDKFSARKGYAHVR